MRFLSDASRALSIPKLAGLALVTLTVVSGADKAALAAPPAVDGCSSVNAGMMDMSLSTNGTQPAFVSGFSAGDRLTFTLTGTLPVTSDHWSVWKAGNMITSASFTNGTVVRTLTVDGPDELQSVIQKQNGTLDTVTVTVTCVPGPKPVVGPTASDKVRGVQVQGSMQAASVSGAVITDAVSGATSDAFANGGAPITMSSGGIVMNFTADVESQHASDPRNARVLDALAYAGGRHQGAARHAGARQGVEPVGEHSRQRL